MTTTVHTVHSKEDMVAWLRDLDSKISRIVPIVMKPSFSGNSHFSKRRSMVRKLTREEFALFLKIAPHFLVVPFSAQFGFNFGVHLYDHPKSPSLEAKHIFQISGKYLPVGMGETFEDAWGVLSQLSHNHQNIRQLQQCRMAPPREKRFYQH